MFIYEFKDYIDNLRSTKQIAHIIAHADGDNDRKERLSRILKEIDGIMNKELTTENVKELVEASKKLNEFING